MPMFVRVAHRRGWEVVLVQAGQRVETEILASREEALSRAESIAPDGIEVGGIVGLGNRRTALLLDNAAPAPGRLLGSAGSRKRARVYRTARAPLWIGGSELGPKIVFERGVGIGRPLPACVEQVPKRRDALHLLHLPHALELRTVRAAQLELIGGIEAPDDQRSGAFGQRVHEGALTFGRQRRPAHPTGPRALDQPRKKILEPAVGHEENLHACVKAVRLKEPGIA